MKLTKNSLQKRKCIKKEKKRKATYPAGVTEVVVVDAVAFGGPTSPRFGPIALIRGDIGPSGD